jgi:hypothetical protein
MIRRPASLHAVPRCGGVPALHGKACLPFGTIRALRLPVVRPASLRFPSFGGSVNAFARLRSRRPCERTPPGGPGLLGFGQPLPICFSTETTGSPKFLENPYCTFAGLFDPGRTKGV